MNVIKSAVIWFISIFFVISPAAARELVRNGEFNDNFAGWTDWKISDTVVYNKSIDETGVLSGPHSAKFDIFSGSDTDWHIQFHYKDFATQKTAKYYVSFKAGFDGVAGSYALPVAVRNPLNDASPVIMQHNEYIPYISQAATKVHQFVFEADTLLTNTQLNFFLGGSNDIVIWIDDVSIVEEGPFWLNQPLENMTGLVEVKYNVYPDSAFKGIVGMSNGKASSNDDIVCGLYFGPDGYLKALHGQTLQADTDITYEENTGISVTLLANIPGQTYDLTVRPHGQSETVLASGYDFKMNAASLNYLVTNVNIDPDDGGRPMTGMRVGSVKVSNITQVAKEKHTALPAGSGLAQNYPNPFNSATTIEFSVAAKQPVSLQIYNLSGTKVKDLFNRPCAAGRYKIRWNGTNETDQPVPSGVYYARFIAGPRSFVKKMLLVR